jgi:TetR/AcrR family transcriptional regulator, mexJK operon transcriptional repressor
MPLPAIARRREARLRRLVIGEAGRFPELGRTYWERGFERGLATLADRLQRLAERGLLRLEDPQLAAQQFAEMLLWVPVNRVMFCGEAGALTPAEIDRYANGGAHALLTADGTNPSE